jgi:hypothetical protein
MKHGLGRAKSALEAGQHNGTLRPDTKLSREQLYVVRWDD